MADQIDLVMGLDMGTSSIKLLLLNIETNSIELDLRKSTLSAKAKTENELFNEQDVTIIVRLLTELLSEIPNHFIGRIKAIQLCGQVRHCFSFDTTKNLIYNQN